MKRPPRLAAPAHSEPREPLPPGHPVSWHAITAGTQFAAVPYPWALRALDLRDRPSAVGSSAASQRNK
jgi:hypothetical protein